MSKRFLVVLLIGVLLMPAALFANGGQDDVVEVVSEPGIFPIEPGLELTGGYYLRGGAPDPNANPILVRTQEESNITIDWVIMEDQNKANIVFAADDYPDFGTADGLFKSLIAKLLDEGVVVDLTQYLGKGYTPNLDAIFAKYPESLAYCLNPDGKLGALPGFMKLESNYLEQNFMINKVWLDRLGLDVPTTTAELKDVLIAFRDGDPNGNGKSDELPFSFLYGDGFAQHIKCMYGWWGMATKNGIAIEDGECYWVPAEDAYREFIEFMADLYEEGLIDPEALTWTDKNRGQFNAKIDSPDGNKYGFIIAPRGYVGTPGRSEFISIAPPAPAGYTPEVWVHPGHLAIKNQLFITDSNEYPEHTMAWFDTFYTLEASVQNQYGIAPEGVKKVGDSWIPQEVSDERREQIRLYAFPTVFDYEDYAEGRIELNESEQFLYENYYNVYVDYKAEEQWVRAEFSGAEQEELNTIKIDLNKLWTSNQVQWIAGTGDLDDEWDDYVAQMKSAGMDRYVELHQIAHDRFLAGQ